MSDEDIDEMRPLARATLASSGLVDPLDGLVWRVAVSLAKVRAEEREACAMIADDAVGTFAGNPDYAAHRIAAAIRGRK